MRSPEIDATDELAGARPPDRAALLRAEAARLAKLDDVGYMVERRAVAKALGVPVGELDKLVDKAKPKPAAAKADTLAPPPPVPWPEPVEPAAVLDELRAFIRRFIVLDEHAVTAVALWIAFAHAFEIAEVSPRLAVLSATKRCGKTRLIELLGLLCPSAIAASNLTPSAIFRTIDAGFCTLLIDEADTFTRENGELRGLLNSGHTKTAAYVIRSVPTGEGGKEWTPRRFSTWCPIAIAAIGRLPETWLDRAIVIPMKRKLRSQPVERLTRANQAARAQAAALASKLVRLAQDSLEAVRNATPEPPPLDSDRQVDNWELLLAIANLGSPDWAKRARAAAVALSGKQDETADSLPLKMLADVYSIFEAEHLELIGSAELCEKLVALELSPWSTISRGRPLTPARLARLLRQFEVYPRNAGKQNGYARKDVARAYTPYQSSEVHKTLGRVAQNDDFKVPCTGTLKTADCPTERTTSGTSELSKGGMDTNMSVSAAEEAEIDRALADEGETCPHGDDSLLCGRCESEAQFEEIE